MKLAAAFMLTAVSAQLDKCARIPLRTNKLTRPSTINNSGDQPKAINFLINHRGDLMKIFGAGYMVKDEKIVDIEDELRVLAMFSDNVEDQYLGQIYRAARHDFRELVSDGEVSAKDGGKEYAALFTENTQRLSKVLATITWDEELMTRIAGNTDFTMRLKELAEERVASCGTVYKQFVDAHIEAFVPWIKAQYTQLDKIRNQVTNKILKLVMDEKIKQSYRAIINELPLIYQFFNDNIHFIEANNVDKSLEEAIAQDIMIAIATQSDQLQMVEMITRHKKFIKKLMTHRATQQQKEKAVGKVMEKNKEIKEAVYDDKRYNELREEYLKEYETISKDMEAEIWAQVKAESKQKQTEEKGNQMKVANEKEKLKKEKKSLTRYEHLAGLLGLFPDDLLETVAEMVKESCPELDLIKIDTPEMKATVEEQPTKFLDQLIQELHDVCDMFGLIPEGKVFTTMSNGVEIQMYADDFMAGPKVQW